MAGVFPDARAADGDARRSDLLGLLPDVGVHDLQCLPVSEPGAGRHRGLLRRRLEPNARHRPERTLPLTLTVGSRRAHVTEQNVITVDAEDACSS